MRIAILVFLTSCAIALIETSFAADQTPQPPRLVAAGIPGVVVVRGDGPAPEEVYRRFLDSAGGEEGRLVIVSSGTIVPDEAGADAALAAWRKRGATHVQRCQAALREDADREEFYAPLREATGVWIEGDSAEQIENLRGSQLAKELQALLERGGVVAAHTHAGELLALLPDAFLDAAGDEVESKHPGKFAVRIDDETAFWIKGRRMEVIGKGNVTVRLAPSSARPAREIVVKPGDIADLTALRRAARARAGELFPAAELKPAAVENGSLLIVGGGRLTRPMVEKFIELAGGPDAPLAVIPSAEPDPLPPDEKLVEFLRRAGAKEIHVVHARTLEQAEAPELLEIMRRVKGVWFGGGRQWRFVDSFERTTIESLCHDVLRRGGVIGGSSAGATIQGEYLVRGSPLGNLEMMAEGYERGFSFLPGSAIDQHFAQRNRFADMEAVVHAFPQLLGIGIDEATALVVRGPIAEVMGENQAHFYDARAAKEGAAAHTVVGAGGRYHLVERKQLE